MTEYAYSRNDVSISALTSMSTIWPSVGMGLLEVLKMRCRKDCPYSLPPGRRLGTGALSLWTAACVSPATRGRLISMQRTLEQAVATAGYYPALAAHVL